ncbi:MAG TPA: hypothetical protein VGB02_04740 [Pyrinomonadaceae bacterium]|jgi:hypothetical protein
MQNSQEINWFAILAPSLIVGLSAVIVQIILAFWLSKVTENHKKDLSKEIESYKIQLQSDFQTKFYEFQIRFSTLHQQRADVFQNVYAKINSIERELLIVRVSKISPSDEESLVKRIKLLNERMVEFDSYWREKRIFIDADTCKIIDELYSLINDCSKKIYTSNFVEYNELDSKLIKAKKTLEEEFRQLLTPEIPNYQLEKKHERNHSAGLPNTSR